MYRNNRRSVVRPKAQMNYLPGSRGATAPGPSPSRPAKPKVPQASKAFMDLFNDPETTLKIKPQAADIAAAAGSGGGMAAPNINTAPAQGGMQSPQVSQPNINMAPAQGGMQSPQVSQPNINMDPAQNSMSIRGDAYSGGLTLEDVRGGGLVGAQPQQAQNPQYREHVQHYLDEQRRVNPTGRSNPGGRWGQALPGLAQRGMQSIFSQDQNDPMVQSHQKAVFQDQLRNYMQNLMSSRFGRGF